MSIAKKVMNSGNHRDAFRAKCEAAKNCEVLELIKAIETRWNSHGKAILRMNRLQPGVHDLCSDKTLPFRKYALTMQEWDIIEELEDILSVGLTLSHHQLNEN